MYDPLSSSPPTQQEHPSVSNRERFKSVVSYSLQLLFIVSGFVGMKLGSPILAFIDKMPQLSYFLIELLTAFHFFFMVVLLTTTLQQPENGAIFESLVMYVMNGIISYIFLDYINHCVAVLSIIFWLLAVVVISIIKRKDLYAQYQTFCISFLSFLGAVRDSIKFLWNACKQCLSAAVGKLKFLWNACKECLSGVVGNNEEVVIPYDQVPQNTNNIN